MINVCFNQEKIPDVVTPIYKLNKNEIHNPAVVKTLLNQNMQATKIKGKIVNVGRLAGGITDFNCDLHALRRINYQGFVEADKITTTKNHVIVTDGFSGNIALKTAEGVSKFITDSLKKNFCCLWAP